MKFKQPSSILVAVYCKAKDSVLLLKRKDNAVWQSITGTIEINEQPYVAAIREVKEETGIIIDDKSDFIDLQEMYMIDILPEFLHKYKPGTLQIEEHWFLLNLEDTPEIIISEHSAYQWLPSIEACFLTDFLTNKKIIQKYILQ